MASRSKVRNNGSGEVKAQKKFGKRLFPKNSLEEALIIPQKLKEVNGGNSWNPGELAKACEMSSSSTNFYYLTAASRDYGLTSGNRDSSKIELTPLGRELVYAPNADTELQVKVRAFLTVDVFKKVLDYYKGSDLPEMKYLGNTLENEFHLSPDTHEEFSRIFKANCKYLGIKSGDSRPIVTTTQHAVGNAGASPTVVVGEPQGTSAPKLFVIMPFTERQETHPEGFFNETLLSLITPAAVKAGFHVETANRQGSDVIQSTIINDLLEADLVLADLTEHNPNVLFELGVRIAHNKPVVLIKASGTGRIFDIDNMLRVYEYDSNLWQSTIETDLLKLKEHIESAWKNRESDQTYMKILRRGGAIGAESGSMFVSASSSRSGGIPTGQAGRA